MRNSYPVTPDKELDLLSLTGMLSVLVNRGACYGQVFKVIGSYQSEWLQPVLRDLEKSVVQGGESLSKALSRHPEVFPEIYVAMIELGESCNLPRAIDRLYRQLARNYRKSQVLTPASGALATACQSIADVLETGGCLRTGLNLTAKTSDNPVVREALLDLLEQIVSGTALAECRLPSVFPSLFSGLVAAHEAVGSLAGAFQDLAELLAPLDLEKPPALPAGPPVPLDSAALAVFEKELARHIGPLARVIVDREARGPVNRWQMARKLAGHITNLQEQRAFLCSIRRLA